MIRASYWVGVVTGVALLFGVGLLGTHQSLAATDEPSPAAGTTTSTTSSNVTVNRVTTTTTVVEQSETSVHQSKPVVRKVAIFVKNRADKSLDSKVMALEDLITGRITDMGFSVISREDAANAVSSFASQGANAGDEKLPGADLDALMSNNTSALRLAKNLNADYLFVVSIVSYDSRKRAFKGYGVDREVRENTLRLSYKLLDNVQGGSLTGGTIKSTEKTQLDPNHKPSEATTAKDPAVGYNDQYYMLNDLLDDASEKLAASLQGKVKKDQIREGQVAEGKLAKFQVICDIADWTLPEVTRTADGQYVVGESTYKVGAVAATVELDGVVVGSTPGPFEAARGLSKIRITRALCDDWARTISVRDGLNLHVSLTLSKEGLARLKDSASFLEGLKAGVKLDDAQVKKIEGYAQMLRQSGFKVDVKSDHKSDIKSDVKVDEKSDTKIDAKGGTEGIVQVNKSLWSW